MDKDAERMFADLARRQKRERQREWREESGYNDRWSVETAFSTFKCVLGECANAQKWRNTKAKIYGKACLYNHMIDTTTDNGCGTPRIVYRSERLSSQTTRQEGRQ